jgi:hypothetical protein
MTILLVLALGLAIGFIAGWRMSDRTRYERVRRCIEDRKEQL